MKEVAVVRKYKTENLADPSRVIRNAPLKLVLDIGYKTAYTETSTWSPRQKIRSNIYAYMDTMLYSYRYRYYSYTLNHDRN